MKYVVYATRKKVFMKLRKRTPTSLQWEKPNFPIDGFSSLGFLSWQIPRAPFWKEGNLYARGIFGVAKDYA